MHHLSALPPLSWSQQLRSQMQSRPLTALGLFIALVAVLLLLLQSLIMLATGDVTSGVRYGLIGGQPVLPLPPLAPCPPSSCGRCRKRSRTPCWALPLA